jgi:flagellar L-ring protein precursor FlgH
VKFNLVICQALICASLCGCSAYTEKLVEGPELSPVGSGLTASQRGEVTGSYVEAASAKKDWVGGPADYFRDSRARHTGDLITVRISINDNANFNSTSDRSRKSSANGSASFDLGIGPLAGKGSGTGAAKNDSASSGQGTVTRSEKLNVSLTVIVRDVYPNGTMLVEGSQEVLVNLEKRIVHVSGIVDPRFINTDNSVDYSKIAEARISYGGSGKVSEAQKPRWGVQLWDKFSPF